MSETETMDLTQVKFGELEVSEIERHVRDSLPDDVLGHLSGENGEVNQKIFDKVIKSSQENPLWAQTPAQGVIDALVDKFVGKVITGKVAKLLYVGGVDSFLQDKELAQYQRALFLSLDEDNELVPIKYYDRNEPSETPTFRVWGRHPGWKETDEFEAGNIYDIEIDIKNETYNGEDRTFYNAGSYQLNENAFSFTKDFILETESFNDILAGAVGDKSFSKPLVEMISDEAQWEDVIAEFEFVRASVRNKSVRKLKTVKGEQVYVNQRTEEEEPVLQTSDTGITSLAVRLSGQVELEGGQVVRYFANFYPQRMGQLFLASPTLSTVFNNPDFINATPEQQVDFLNMMLQGKTFRTFGQITGFNASDDETTLFVSQKPVALVEVTEEE